MIELMVFLFTLFSVFCGWQVAKAVRAGRGKAVVAMLLFWIFAYTFYVAFMLSV